MWLWQILVFILHCSCRSQELLEQCARHIQEEQMSASTAWEKWSCWTVQMHMGALGCHLICERSCSSDRKARNILNIYDTKGGFGGPGGLMWKFKFGTDEGGAGLEPGTWGVSNKHPNHWATRTSSLCCCCKVLLVPHSAINLYHNVTVLISRMCAWWDKVYTMLHDVHIVVLLTGPSPTWNRTTPHQKP